MEHGDIPMTSHHIRLTCFMGCDMRIFHWRHKCITWSRLLVTECQIFRRNVRESCNLSLNPVYSCYQDVSYQHQALPLRIGCHHQSKPQTACWLLGAAVASEFPGAQADLNWKYSWTTCLCHYSWLRGGGPDFSVSLGASSTLLWRLSVDVLRFSMIGLERGGILLKSIGASYASTEAKQ